MIEIPLRGAESRRAGVVYCLGRNYVEHAKEMKADPEPVVFIKPASALRPGGGEIPWPHGSSLVHHEVELVVLLRAGGRDIDTDAARAAIEAIGLGIDLTARDLQARAKEKGQPWARAKGFPGSAPVTELVPVAAIDEDWGAIDLELSVGDEIRQRARAAEMTLDMPTIVSTLSRYFELAPGDLIFTGTPAGVGPLDPGREALARSRALGLELRIAMASSS